MWSLRVTGGAIILSGLVSFGEANGNLYLVSIDGTIFRLAVRRG